ncbi:MAG: DUF4437 domain-containing protein [Methylophilaceae bacterium]
MKLLPIALAALMTVVNPSLLYAHELGSNKKPLAFGNDQTIIDLNKLEWAPLQVKGLAPGAEIAVLRGDLATGASELVLRLPPNYYVRNHTHTSDELYVWLKGAFTLIAHDGTKTKFDGPAYISFPGNAPPHALKCGSKQPCILYLRYSRPFDIEYSPDAKGSQ